MNNITIDNATFMYYGVKQIKIIEGNLYYDTHRIKYVGNEIDQLNIAFTDAFAGNEFIVDQKLKFKRIIFINYDETNENHSEFYSQVCDSIDIVSLVKFKNSILIAPQPFKIGAMTMDLSNVNLMNKLYKIANIECDTLHIYNLNSYDPNHIMAFTDIYHKIAFNCLKLTKSALINLVLYATKKIVLTDCKDFSIISIHSPLIVLDKSYGSTIEAIGISVDLQHDSKLQIKNENPELNINIK